MNSNQRSFRETFILGIVLMLVTLGLLNTNALVPVNRLIYDSFIRLDANPATDDIVIIAVDGKSLSQLGRWPWSRSIHAKLLSKLEAFNLKVIGLSIFFSEPDTDHPEDDLLLEEVTRRLGNVILPAIHDVSLTGNDKIAIPMNGLLKAAAGLGHVDVELDGDGIARSVLLSLSTPSEVWPSLGLAMYQHGMEPEIIESESGHVLVLSEQQDINNKLLKSNKMLIPFAGPPGTIQRISFVDVLKNRVNPVTLANKFVLIGVTAKGVGGNLATPASNKGGLMPGVEVNANILNALLNGKGISTISLPWIMTLAGIITLLPVVIYPLLTPRYALAAMMFLFAFALILSYLIFWKLRLWFPPASLLLAQMLSYPLWSLRRLEFAGHSLFEHIQRSDVTLEAIGDAVITTNTQGVAEYLNPVALQLADSTMDNATGKLIGELLQADVGENRVSIDALLEESIRDNKIIKLPNDTIVKNSQHKELAIVGTIAPIRDGNGKPQGAVVAISDVTEMRDLMREMEHQANHDVLTGLPNRVLLRDRVEHAIMRAKRTESFVIILFIDLDGFKTVNDGLGHFAGDKLLKSVAERLRNNAREEDTIARIGGDEFVMILEHIHTADQIDTVAQKVQALFEKPFMVDRHELFVGASIGVSAYPKDGDSHEVLLTNADTAMYRAKASGRNTICFFGQEMNSHALKRLVMEQELRRAIYKDDLVLHYQPVVDLKTRKVTGVEALVRWQHPERGLISPAEFIPLAEENGLIVPLGEWVMNTACEQAKEWSVNNVTLPFRVAVNLSPRQFLQSNFPSLVQRILARTELNPKFLEFEITENQLMQDVVGTVKMMQVFADMGISLSIDDFGTGYSSLEYLSRFPIARLKIDRSFVTNINTDSDKSAIAHAVIAMAHSMSLSVVAEGVEKVEQYNFLKEKQCDEIQGFYFCKPLPDKEMHAYFNRMQEQNCVS